MKAILNLSILTLIAFIGLGAQANTDITITKGSELKVPSYSRILDLGQVKCGGQWVLTHLVEGADEHKSLTQNKLYKKGKRSLKLKNGHCYLKVSAIKNQESMSFYYVKKDQAGLYIESQSQEFNSLKTRKEAVQLYSHLSL